ncbi:peptidase S8/S53 subtilisin kexin sedolisin [Actinomadura verrucosospora]|uniref:Peptidase S8/S53 subtilisin kexin sedolisin n=2 Tax=Actinomadura verrucosospora TaxID=46165 RepID=A0A7D3ZYZ9_ACTVE|nr:peptidase S8/S53 subtilisin kexin sedolisin [Actinomadura verrucosospora]
MLAAPSVSVGSIGKAGVFTPGGTGTSSATALTSGVVALMRSHFPDMPGREIVQRMLATARDVGPEGWDKKTGYGALIPYKALTANVPKTAPNPVYDNIQATGSGAPNNLEHARHKPARTSTHSKSDEPGYGFNGLAFIAALTLTFLSAAGIMTFHSKRRWHSLSLKRKYHGQSVTKK